MAIVVPWIVLPWPFRARSPGYSRPVIEGVSGRRPQGYFDRQISLFGYEGRRHRYSATPIGESCIRVLMN